ncbi:hypothetical protein EV360DRAFT_88705 [Lentinula raphanica]|nr:hypothetical protein EV360DRAFT_88705 [Lentinula raphanica]
MQPFKLLPNELLSSVLEHIAYTSILPDSPFKSEGSFKSSFKCASRELLALSVADWRLRRVCLPFLFANIKLRNVEVVEKMKDQLAFFSKFTKFLVIGTCDALTTNEEDIISQILPQLKQLSYVELWGRSVYGRTVLIKTLLAHPTVTSVLVPDVDHESMDDEDLSKVTLQETYWQLCPRRYFERGMKLVRLNIDRSFDSQLFLSEMFAGPKEMRITMSNAVTSSFLSALLSTFPTLEELWPHAFGHHFDARTPSCICPSIKKSQWPSLNEHDLIRRIGLRRTIGQPSDEWHVMGIAMVASASHANTSLLAKLGVVASSFPTVENVTLDFSMIRYKFVYALSTLIIRSSPRYKCPSQHIPPTAFAAGMRQQLLMLLPPLPLAATATTLNTAFDPHYRRRPSLPLSTLATTLAITATANANAP